jgi:hypothetical protein
MFVWMEYPILELLLLTFNYLLSAICVFVFIIKNNTIRLTISILVLFRG